MRCIDTKTTGHGSVRRCSFGEFAPRSRSLQVHRQRSGGVDDVAVCECMQRELQHTARRRQQRRIDRTTAFSQRHPRSARRRHRPPSNVESTPGGNVRSAAVAMRSSPLNSARSPSRTYTPIVDLVGARPDRREHAPHIGSHRERRLRQRRQRRNRHDRNRDAEADALRDAGGDAHAGERTGAASECDASRSNVRRPRAIASAHRSSAGSVDCVDAARCDGLRCIDAATDNATEHATVDVSSANSVGACAVSTASRP